MPDDEETVSQTGTLGPGGDESLDPGGENFIEDSTPEDQLEREESLLTGKQIDDDGDPADRDDADGPEDRPSAEEDISSETVEPEKPQPKYTDEDVERIRREVQSARDREVEEYRVKALKAELENDREARVEAYLRTMAQQLVNTGRFDEEEARQQVFTEANRNQLRREYELGLQNTVLQSQQQTQVYDQQQRQAYDLFGQRAKDVQKKLKLDKQDMAMLLAQVPDRFDSFEHMERFEQAFTNQALSLYKRRGRSRVPNGAPERQPTSGRSSGASESKDQRALRIMEKPSWEWTKDDHAALKDSLR